MYETRIRYDVELGQESGPGFFRKLKQKQFQKRCENDVRQYRQLATDTRTKKALDVPLLSDVSDSESVSAVSGCLIAATSSVESLAPVSREAILTLLTCDGGGWLS